MTLSLPGVPDSPRTFATVESSAVGEPGSHVPAIESVADVERLLSGQGYVADRGITFSLFLAHRLGRPLFLEGESGVGKTEVAKAFAAGTGARLIRLQCYEGIDTSQALYDWNYARQILYIRALQVETRAPEQIITEVFSSDFLLRRPLLDAISSSDDVVLLIDEIDRADDEFEAFLLEILSDFQISIPEIGTIRASRRPSVILTSNRTREVHDALKRRCLYHWISFPERDRQLEILRRRIPRATADLAEQICACIEALRGLNLQKPPGIGETLDWAAALVELDMQHIDPAAAEVTIGAVLKMREDQERALTEVFSISPDP
jgi:MoxR-like ATPase